ncbi:MAG: hypothetical protein AABY16_04985 [Nanoarchaeota archaeon]
MGLVKAGFTGGFIGIVIGVAAIFVKSPIIQKLSYLGFLLAESFGKACIDTAIDSCSLFEKFTTIIATIVGNCIAYFIVGMLISLGFSVLKLWLSPEKPVQQQESEQPPQPAPSPKVARQEAPKQIIEKTQIIKQKSQRRQKKN